jgi:PilZ domain
MPSDISVLIADPTKVAAIRETVSLPGRLMPFAGTALASALASIQAYRPKTIAIVSMVADTPSGTAFLEQIEPLVRAGSSILLLAEQDGEWTATPHGSSGGKGGGRPRPARPAGGSESRIVAPSAQAVAAVSTMPAAPPSEPVYTRRAPRFLVRKPLDVVVESGHASLVDMSVLGAQIVSLPVLRPKQKIKVDLTDSDEKTLSVFAHVAWSMFEKPQPQAEPHYRVGLEFTGAAQQALEHYRQRHCTAQPIPQRGR